VLYHREETKVRTVKQPEITLKKLAEIKPYDKNPRNNEAAVQLVANSIKEFGFKVPIVVDKAGVIVCGHARHKAAQLLGLSEVPCIVADDLTPAQVRAYRLADNKVAEASQWEFEKLDDELAWLADFDIDIDMTDFGFVEAPKIEFEEFSGAGDGGGSQLQHGDKLRIVVGAAMFDIADPTHELYAKTKNIDTESLGAAITELIRKLAK
jgi:ParB family chromosome partitioning protein